MAYDEELAGRVRTYLLKFPDLKIEEKKMFRGSSFLVNGKMCVNVSGKNLMCRFDPDLTEDVSKKKGFLPMVMKGKKLMGYCYVEPKGFKLDKDLKYWINLCMDFNEKAKSSKKRKK